MTKKLLVSANITGSPDKLERIFSMLQRLGNTARIQPSTFTLTTNVTMKGVRSALREELEEGDSLCLAVTTQIVTH
jgi:hypothetical protein